MTAAHKPVSLYTTCFTETATARYMCELDTRARAAEQGVEDTVEMRSWISVTLKTPAENWRFAVPYVRCPGRC